MPVLFTPRFLARRVLIPGVFVFALDGLATKAASYTWTNPSGGSWDASGNWSGGGLPTNPGDIADFSELGLTGSEIITLDANQSAGDLLFGDTNNTYDWTVANGTGGPWTLTLAASSGAPVIDVVNQSATIAVPLAGTVGLNKTGAGNLILAAANTYTGATTVPAGTLTLDFSQPGAPATDIITNTVPAVLNLSGGSTLALKGNASAADSQSFASFAVGSGANVINLTQNGATSLTVNLGAITQTVGGTLNFSVVPLTTGVVATTTNANVNGILGPWATVGTGTSTQYATVSGGDIVAYTGATAATNGQLANVTSATSNYTFSAAGTLTGSRAANTLQYIGAGTTTALSTFTLALNGLLNTGSGTLIFSSAAGGGIQIGSTNELVIQGPSSVTIKAPISDDGANPSSLTYSGAGTLTLNTSASTYTGTTTVDSGIVSLGLANVLASASSIVVNSGTLAMGANAQSVNAVTLTSGSITGTGTFASATGFNFQSGTVAPILAGGGGLTKTTAGTVKLSNVASTYTGVTTIDGGILNVALLANVDTASSIGAGSASGSAADLVFGGGTLQISAASAALSTNRLFTIGDSNGGSATIDSSAAQVARPLSFTGTGNIAFGDAAPHTLILTGSNTGANTFDPVIGDQSSGNPTTLIKNGSGAWTLGGSNFYTGPTIVNGGTLTLGTLDAIDSASVLTVNAGTFAIGSSPDTLAGINLVSGSITGTLNVLLSTTGPINVQSGTVAANLNGAAAINKTTSATVIISKAPTLGTSGVNILDGTIQLGVAQGLSNGNNVTLGDSVANTPGILDLNGFLQAVGLLTAVGSGQSLITNGAAGKVSTLTIGGASIFGGVIQDGAGQIAVVKSNAGILTFTGANTYTGGTTVNNGILVLSAKNGVQTNILSPSGAVILGAGTATVPSPNIGDLQLGDSSGPISQTVASIAENPYNTATTQKITGGYYNASNPTAVSSLTVNTTTTDTYTGIIGNGTVATTAANNISLTTTGTGTLILSPLSTNTYNGGTYINGGTLALGVANALPATGAVNVNGGILDLASFSTNAGGVTLTSGSIVDSAGGGVLFGSSYTAQNGNISAVLGDSASPSAFTKTTDGSPSAGTVTLSGANTYTGATNINAGTVVVSGSLNGTTSVAVNHGGVLGGNGAITTGNNGNVTVASGGSLAPGLLSSPGTLTLSLGTGLLDVSATAGGTGWLLYALGTTSDEIQLTSGTLNIGTNGLQLNDFAFTNSGGFGQGTYVLFAANTPITGTLGANTSGTVLGLGATLQFADGGTELVLNVVPEPGALPALFGGLATLLGLKRMRRRRPAGR